MSKLRLATIALVVAGATASAYSQTYKVVYNFGSQSGDPTNPRFSGAIAQGRDGNLFSTANDLWTDGIGAAFAITPGGALTVLHHFHGGDGQAPQGGLVLGVDGNYYGTTETGGDFGFGSIFRMTAQGTLTTLYSFTGAADGGYPSAAPIQSIGGDFYGTTVGKTGDNGSVYKIALTGAFTLLHSFTSTDGANPYAPLVEGIDGNFYGTTFGGGTQGLGTIFRMNPAGKLTVLTNFDGLHGANPYAPLIQGSDSNFYGVAAAGGSSEGGVVFKMTPGHALTVLYNFTGGGDGSNPVGGLLQASDGNFYGTDNLAGALSWGVLFRITPTGIFTVLHGFDWNTGASPQTSLLQHTNGVLFGETAVGGTGSGGDGTFYSLDLSLGPFVTFLPAARWVGATVEVLGQGFTGTNAVSINGAAAKFTVVSDTYLTAVVPKGATTGVINVTTPSGVLVSNKKIQVGPQITSFSPTGGPVGTAVTITGLSLTNASAVRFGGVSATGYTVNSDTQVTATVPAGALPGRINITTTGAPTSSTTAFAVTP